MKYLNIRTSLNAVRIVSTLLAQLATGNVALDWVALDWVALDWIALLWYWASH